MTEKKHTSRQWILDGIEMCGNYIALASHLQEIVNSYGKNDYIKEDEYFLCIDLIEECNEERRKIMNKILKEFEGNKLFWCALKHSIAVWQYSTELYYSNMNDKDFEEFQKKGNDIMYSVLSNFIGLSETVMCGRCLNDMIEN